MKESTFGSLIRSLRLQNGMTQARLADLIGVTDKAVSKWERNISYPDITLFPKLANILGVTINDLLSEAVDDGQPSRLVQIFEMSHDIRTPLHIILGCADMAEIHCEDKDLLMRYLKSIRLSGEYLLRSFDRVMQTVEGGGEETPGKEPWRNGRELEQSIRDHSMSAAKRFEAYDFTGKRILVAEDLELNREIIGGILKQTGARMHYAPDGQACLEMMEDAPAGYYDLILMDVMMPRMDGMEATRRIRKLADPKKASIPIIAVTADVYRKDRRAALDAGMDAFTEKPIFIDNLLEIMRQYLHEPRNAGSLEHP